MNAWFTPIYVFFSAGESIVWVNSRFPIWNDCRSLHIWIQCKHCHIFFLMCHIIVALYYVQAKERKFSALKETQRATLCFTLRDVGEKDKDLFLLSQEASTAAIFVFTCIKDLTMISPSTTLFLQGWLSKKRILLKQLMGWIYPFIGCLHFHVPVIWLFWSTISIKFSQNVQSVSIANLQVKSEQVTFLSNSIRFFPPKKGVWRGKAVFEVLCLFSCAWSDN